MPADTASVVVTSDFAVCGQALTAADADALRRSGLALIEDASSDDIMVDLSQLKQANSVLVAVLLAWYRRSYQLEKSLRLTHPSPELQAIISFSGLDELFSQ